MEEPNISKYLKSSRTPTSDEWEMFPAEPYPVRKIKFDTFNELEYFDIRPKYDATEEELEDAIQDFLQAPDKYWCDLEARMKKMFRNVDHEEEAATLHSLQRWRESWFTNHTRLVPSIFPWTDAATIFCFLRLFLEDDGHAIPNQPSPLIDKSSFNETYFLGRRLSYDATQDQVKECIADFYGAPNTYWEDLKFRVGKFKLDHPRNKRIPSEFQLMLCKRDYWLAKTPFHPIKSYYPWKDLHEICVLLRKLKEANLGSASLFQEDPSFLVRSLSTLPLSNSFDSTSDSAGNKKSRKPSPKVKEFRPLAEELVQDEDDLDIDALEPWSPPYDYKAW